MEFEWDADKDQSNRAKHGVSFSEAIAVFADPDIVLIDASREQDNERRTKAIGQIEGRLFVVVFTERGRAIRLISARRTNRVEEESYGRRQSEA